MGETGGDYAVLISLSTREEAEVAASALRASGIDAFVGNTNHAGMQWLYVVALGGLQVFVPRDKLADAKAYLRACIRENAGAEPDERVSRRDRWKIWLIAAYLYGPIIVWQAVNAGLLPESFLVPDVSWRLRGE